MSTSNEAPPRTQAQPTDEALTQSRRSRFRVKVPTVLQMEATECGAASLGMVLGRYGRVESLDELRVRSGVSRDGATANNILRAARSFGMTAKAYKREPEQLKSMTFPLIIHWRFYHYVVVEGWYPGGWYLNDPASGPRQCEEREFDESFTGVTISLVPGPEFTPGGRRAGIVGRLLAAAGNVRPAIIAAIIAALLLLVPTLLVPQVLKVYGNQLADVGSSLAVATAVGLLLALLIQTVLLSLQGSISVRTSTKITVRLGATMVQRLLQLPTAFHAQRGAASIAQRAVLLDTLSEAVSALVLTMTTGVLTAVAAAVVLLLIDPFIGAIAVAVSVIMALVLHFSVRKARDEASKVVVEQVETGRVFASALSQIESIKASGAEDGVIARGIAAENRLLEANQRIGVRMLGLNLLPSFMGGLSVVIIAGFSLLGIINGRLEPGQLLAILALTGVLIAPMAQIVMALGQTQLLRATLDQVDDVLNAEVDSEWSPSGDAPAPGVIRGELEGTGLTFGYSPTGPPVITDVSFHVDPGRRVALVGPSGCGKSTLSRLVLGLYQPWSGELRIDGRLRSEHAPEVLTDALALVDQDVAIFAGTVRENITLWDATIPETDILEAVADAQLSDDVSRRPGGLDAVLLEGGKDLSGGQRQRLEIARALVRRPRLLVMDEATSALDPTTEKAIDEAIRRRGITCLVIAHRLSTIRDSDEIIVLERGSVVERGTHEQLMANDGEYARLVGSG